VRWLGGGTNVVQGLDANRLVKITEGNPEAG
jgi:hypothetical protein